ncbi:MAG TPA: alpha-amylase [Planktothrix sp. UBA10369]|nr:alpha-amylase [Planktothrix sp. UBA10369]
MVKINGVMMQYFHWYLPADGSLWNQLKNNAQELADAGITALWLPPAYKGTGGGMDVGYGVYDIYDLGEFDQKGSIRTKYGTRQQYLDAINSLHKSEIEVYVDTVLNHKMGADGTEIAKATPFPNNNRRNPKGDLRDIKAYTVFNFPGRQGKYSEFEWHWWHFDAVDYDEFTKESGNVYLFEGKTFDDYVALENGNFAYLMGADLDFQHEEVRNEITNWTKWYLDTTGVDGFRLDAIKHISAWFFPEWLDEMEKHTGRKLFTVGEYWSPDTSVLNWYLDTVGDRMSVFDVSLHYNLHYASKAGGYHDMRTILDGTLVKDRAMNAVTFVENHDSQPLQALESVVEPWFKPIAYAIILLRQQGYPCIFYADYYGAEYEDRGRDGNTYKIVLPSHKQFIDQCLYARKNFAYGPQYDYFDHPDIIGWTCLGDEQHPKAMAVLLSDGPEGIKPMEVGKPNTKFYDLTGNIKEPIETNDQGWGEFSCKGGSVSIWVQE